MGSTKAATARRNDGGGCGRMILLSGVYSERSDLSFYAQTRETKGPVETHVMNDR